MQSSSDLIPFLILLALQNAEAKDACALLKHRQAPPVIRRLRSLGSLNQSSELQSFNSSGHPETMPAPRRTTK